MVREPATEPRPTVPVQAQGTDLVDALRLFWRRRLVIGGATLLGLVVALVGTQLVRPLYEATATVMVVQSKIGEGPPLPVNTATFRGLFENNTQAAGLIQEFGLAGPPERLNVERLADRLRVDEVGSSALIHVKLRLSDPDLAARVLNRLVERAIDLNVRLNQDETTKVRDFLKVQLDQARERSDSLEQQYLALRQKSQLELAKTDVEMLLEQRTQLMAIRVQIEAERGRLRSAEAELSKHSLLLDSPRDAQRNTALLDAARRERIQPPPNSRATRERAPLPDGLKPTDEERTRAPERPPLEQREQALGSRVAEPGEPGEQALASADAFVNPVYQVLEYQIATSRTRLASLEQQRAELEGRLQLGQSEAPKLDGLYQKEIAIERLKMEYELARKIYADLATRYEQARIQVASNSGQLQAIDRATVSDRPVSPRLVRVAAVAAGACAVFAMLLVLLADAFVTRSGREGA